MNINKLVILGFLGCISVSCDDFFDKVPYDQLSPATFWNTEDDAKSAAVACYDEWNDSYKGSADVFYADCMSDIGYNYTTAGGFTYVANGSVSQTSTPNYYHYDIIRRCNTFLEYAKDIPFASEVEKVDLFAQIRTIRAYRYFHMNFWYGGVPLITDLPQTAVEAQLPRNSEEEVKKFVYDEIDALLPDLNKIPSQQGRIARGTALAIKMRSALYWGDHQRALDAAKEIREMNMYELHPDFQALFNIVGQSSKEIIYSMQHVINTSKFSNTIRLYNNQDGGWASFAPTQNLVDMYEMESGLLPTDPNSGYDATHPFSKRDPRLALTVVYPGMDWTGTGGIPRVINTLDKTIDGEKNQDFYAAATNASKTGLIWAKYTMPITQYSSSLNNDNLCPILFRYAEVLLTIAEANIELNQNTDEVFDILDRLRGRSGHIKVDRNKYRTQDKLRTLLRRERCLELAGEGLRRADIVRWKDSQGKMLAATVLNETLTRMTGTVNPLETDRDLRATIAIPTAENLSERKLEDRIFHSYQRYLPFPQAELDKNPNLKQNSGYVE